MKNDRSLNYVLEIRDIDTLCIVADAGLPPSTSDEIVNMIGVSDFHRAAAYHLNEDIARKVVAHFEIALDFTGKEVWLRPRTPMDDLPYKTHTGRELTLMLEGSKPLAVFCGVYPTNSDIADVPERQFDPYVAQGKLIKREHIFSPPPPLRRVLYALPGEEWRIDALILLHDTARKSGWSEEFERMEGTLLGYENWQNDAFIESIYRAQKTKRKVQS